MLLPDWRKLIAAVLIVSLSIYTVVYCDEDSDDDSPTEETDEGEEAVKQENGVYVLTNSNFDEFINSRDTVLVEFYAPWCGHCKQLAPEYEKAAKALSDSDPPVSLAKVDATVEAELASRFDVSGYPTLKVFKRGVAADYEGPRNEAGIVEQMKTFSDPNYQPPKDITAVLTESNFTEVTGREELMVVMFYAPWCGHCKKMMPEYEKAAKELIRKDPPVILAKVDATAETNLAAKHEVSGYPTLKIFRKGKAFPFSGEARDKWAIIQYVEKQIGPGSSPVENLNILKKKISSPGDQMAITLVGFFDGPDDSGFNTYLEAANQLRDEYTFHHSFDQSHRSALAADPSSFVVFLTERFQSKHEPKFRQLKITDSTKAQEIVDFLRKHHAPLVGEYNKVTKDKIYKDKPLVLFFYTVDWSFDHRDATQRWRKAFVEIAVKYPKLSFVIADDEENKELFSELGFDDSGEEVNVAILGTDGRKYPMEPMEEFDADEVHSFIKKFDAGKLKPKIKSQAIPAKQSGPVTVVVGKTFEKIVLDPKKDVLIEFYAPWCGHCKKLEPLYKELAKDLKSEHNLIVSKMDATANDSPPNYSSSGFPTIYFAPSNQKDKPILFEGDRTVKGFKEFIKKHAVASFKDKTKSEL